MSVRKINSSNIHQRKDTGDYIGVVRYVDDDGEIKRKSFSSKTKSEAQQKITNYIMEFNKTIEESDESRKKLKDSMQSWLGVFKFPSVERTTYDRLESTARIHVYPALGDKVVSTIKAADIKKLLNDKMNDGYAYSTVKKIHGIIGEYFKFLIEQEYIEKNPMRSVPMIKKQNFMAAQGKDNLPTCDTVVVFTDEEIAKFKEECVRTWGTGKRMYQQSAAYILMLNTGLRTGELLGLLNSDIDLENRVLHINQAVKEVQKRDGVEFESGREIEVGKPKTATSKRTVPLNNTAVEAIKELRAEFYFGEDTPLVCDSKGNYTKPSNLRKRYYRILEAAGIEQKGLHSLRHTFATNLVNGVKQPDGTIKCLTPRQAGDLLGHSTSQITEMYYVKRDNSRLIGITDNFEF
ncbi:MAG: site-specific integrase [Ruminococcaceae bacterium]|nr:site-specific integrase [Oscillospiraceae bacterium]